MAKKKSGIAGMAIVEGEAKKRGRKPFVCKCGKEVKAADWVVKDGEKGAECPHCGEAKPEKTTGNKSGRKNRKPIDPLTAIKACKDFGGMKVLKAKIEAVETAEKALESIGGLARAVEVRDTMAKIEEAMK